MFAELLGVTESSIDSRYCRPTEDLMFVPNLVAVSSIKFRNSGLMRSILPWSLDDIFVYGLKLLGLELGPRLPLLGGKVSISLDSQG